MKLKCSELNGLHELRPNKTTITDIYQNYNVANIDTTSFYSMVIGNRFNNFYSTISEDIPWKRISINNYKVNNKKRTVNLEFFKDTLVLISYRDLKVSKDTNKPPLYITDRFGNGVQPTDSFMESVFKSHTLLEPVSSDCHLYKNVDINMIVLCERYDPDIFIFHHPKLSELHKAVDIAYSHRLSERKTINNKKSQGYGSMDAEDNEYWNSVNREKALRDAGMKDAANIEKKARQNYLQGKGYTSPSGGSKVHFQGSKEQQEQLEEMKRRGWQNIC